MELNAHTIQLENHVEVTKRELSIFQLVSFGLTEEEISKQLSIATSTVQTHKRSLLNKFKANNSCQMIYQACKNNIL